MVANQLVWGKSRNRFVVRFCRMLEGSRAQRYEVLQPVLGRLLSVTDFICDTNDGVEIVLSPDITDVQIRLTVGQLVKLLQDVGLLNGEVKDTRFGTWR